LPPVAPGEDTFDDLKNGYIQLGKKDMRYDKENEEIFRAIEKPKYLKKVVDNQTVPGVETVRLGKGTNLSFLTDIFLRLKNPQAYDYYIYSHYGTDEGLELSGGSGEMPGMAVTYDFSLKKFNKPLYLGHFTQEMVDKVNENKGQIVRQLVAIVHLDDHDGKTLRLETILWKYKGAGFEIKNLILDAHSIKRVFNKERFDAWKAKGFPRPKDESESACNIF
jgi:hypothetical protein